jgi:hypothetical protein
LFFGTPEEIAEQRGGVPVNEFVFGERVVRTKVSLMMPPGQTRLRVERDAVVRKADLLQSSRLS